MANSKFGLDDLCKKELYDITSTVQCSFNCKTRADFDDTLIGLLKKLIPFKTYNTSLVNYNDRGEMTDAFVSTNMRDEWVTPYLQNGKFYIDPIMIKMFSQMNTVQPWQETYDRVDNKEQKSFIKDSLDFFDYAGLSYGAKTVDRREFMSFSLTGGFDSLDTRNQFIFGIIAPLLRESMAQIQKNENIKLLNETQHKILDLVISGLSQASIAEELNLHPKTVAYNIRRIEQITDANNVASAIQRANTLRILEAL